MTGAELKTLRENLGLTSEWLVKRTGVTQCALACWEADKAAVPDYVAELLLSIDALFDATRRALLQTFEQSASDEIVLMRYKTDQELWHFQPEFLEARLSATSYGALLFRTAKALEYRGAKVKMVYMQPEDYLLWLVGKTDCPDMRNEWAGTQARA
ncbi:MAG: hypothetical protein LBV80_04175 [Deltaproteobacteria bacterium]|jgi:transcriptional regulator with XRE-family HTH domain|nr:hypothetical protein [Deltaproteobacteria bacterium]